MTRTQSLPVFLPTVRGQRWSCHSCGHCCRTLVEHLTKEDRRRLDDQGWADELDVAPYVRVRRGWALNKRAGGACVFLDESNRCMIHARHGEAAKPLACRVFPFSLRAVSTGWQASLRFDCPSVASARGKPLGEHRAWVADVARLIERDVTRDDGVTALPGRVRATADELDTLTGLFLQWMRDESRPAAMRVLGAARITATLAQAKLKKVRGERFGELLRLLFGSLQAECATPIDAPSGRQQGMLRQLAFAHAEHVTLHEMRQGMLGKARTRLTQLRAARRFLRGIGAVPPLRGLGGEATFDAVEAVQSGDNEQTGELVCRYVAARLTGRSVFGAGYYAWPAIHGLAALWLSLAVAGWIARYGAAVDGRERVTFEDAALALGVIDRAATRAPSLATWTERTRVSYLLRDDGLARLWEHWKPL